MWLIDESWQAVEHLHHPTSSRALPVKCLARWSPLAHRASCLAVWRQFVKGVIIDGAALSNTRAFFFIAKQKMKQLHFQMCLAVCTSDEAEPCKKEDIWQRTDKSSSCDITCNLPADYRENIYPVRHNPLSFNGWHLLCSTWCSLTCRYLIICLCPSCVISTLCLHFAKLPNRLNSAQRDMWNDKVRWFP